MTESTEFERTDAGPDVRPADAKYRESHRRLARLHGFTAALANTWASADVARVVAQHAAVALDAAGVILCTVIPGESQLRIIAASDLPDDLRAKWQVIPLDARLPLCDVARSGTPLFLGSRAAWSAYPHLIADLEATGHHANAVIPLCTGSTLFGVMGVAFNAPQEFAPDDVDYILTTAELSAQALSRARLYEAEQRARMAAEAGSRAKSEFLAVMSHELRTPLNAIDGYAELMEMEVYGAIVDEQRTALHRIRAGQRHLLRLVNGVLDYMKAEHNRELHGLADVQLADVLRTCEALVLPQAMQKDIALTLDCDASVCTFADRDKVQQVVVNLLANAIKFTDDGGHIDVVGMRADAETIHIVVRDTGHGIEEGSLERIFEPFVQVESGLSHPNEGTGLGLFISRDLARAMQGDLTVQSTPGCGSTFTLSLPTCRRA